MTDCLHADITSFAHEGNKDPLFRNFNFEIQQGEFCSIIGPSAVGKTTLLKILAGLIPVGDGRIQLNGNIYNSGAGTHVPGNVAFLFQECGQSLLPWFTAHENVRVVLNHTLINEDSCCVDDAIERVGLAKYKHYYPHQLSGGLKQRLALARAMVSKPRVVFLDEPFNSLDCFSRKEMDDLLKELWKQFGFTVILVTHEIEEALYLSNKIIALTIDRDEEITKSHILEHGLPINAITGTQYEDINNVIKSIYN